MADIPDSAQPPDGSRPAVELDAVGGLNLIQRSPVCWEIRRSGSMRVPGVLYAPRELLPDISHDRSLEQVANVATLPGIVEASYAMPDVHWGYGFPIGGVAATDVAEGGVVSPGGVGFDISCGVRLLVSDLHHDDLGDCRSSLLDELERRVPRGLGPGAVWQLTDEHHLVEILRRGAVFAVEQGFGATRDLSRCEDGGAVPGADPDVVSRRAAERGLHQVGSLGSGNHFLEVQVVDRIDHAELAAAFGLDVGRVCVMIHCGSRGLGHQVCSDHVKVMVGAMAEYGIEVPDPQLACAPVDSEHGRRYMAAMVAAANYGRANRQLLTHATRRAFDAVVGTQSLDLLYDVSHNLAKLEEHDTDRGRRLLCVHRKGATRALPPGHPDLPGDLAETGQPVMLPGSMGTASYVLAGVGPGGAFHSAAHGAGRTMSRHKARRQIRGAQLRDELEASGIAVRARSNRGLAEEAPFSYKDVDLVAATCEQAGLAQRVARLVPIGVVKG